MQNYRLKNHSFVAMNIKTVCYKIGSKILSRIEMKICNAKYNFCVNLFGFIYCGQQKNPYPYCPPIFWEAIHFSQNLIDDCPNHDYAIFHGDAEISHRFKVKIFFLS